MTSFSKRFSAEISSLIKVTNEEYGVQEKLNLTNCLFTTTQGVSEKNIKEIEKVFETNAIKIKIIPLLRQRHCHTNVNFLRGAIGGRHILGYNITGCACGKHYTLELHSVLKFEGEYIDLTKDFCLEKEKWFIPVIESEEKSLGKQDEIFLQKIKLIRQCKVEIEMVYSWRGTHRCDNSKYFETEPEFNMKMGDAKKFIEYLFSKKVQLKF